MTAQQETTIGTASPPLQPEQAGLRRWEPVLVFVLFAFTVVFAGEYVFHLYREKIRQSTQEELNGIARLKTAQIATWLAERKSSAQMLRDDPLFVAELDAWLRQGGPAGKRKAGLVATMAAMQRSKAAFGCTALTFIDGAGKPRLSTSAGATPLPDNALLRDSLRSGEIAASDIHTVRRDGTNSLEMFFLVPLRTGAGNQARMLGALLFYVDPLNYLFPLVQSWPIASPSAETLLVRRDGDEVVFMNELRHRKQAALNLRLPLDKKELPAAMAALGVEGTVEGIDYRGVPVAAVINPIPGTPWKMVSKIDQAEVYEPIDSLANWIELMMLAFVVAGGGIALFWRRKQLQLIQAMQKQHEQQLQQQALSRRLDHLSRYANDIILLVQDTGRIVEFNDRAVEAYGYSAEELSNMSIFDLRRNESPTAVLDDIRKIQDAGALRFEATHTRKDGSNFPVEISSRVVKIDGKRHQQSIVRDITERKQAEAELTRQKEFVREVIDSNPNLIFVKDADGRFLLANRAMAQSYGLTTQSIVGKFNWELTDRYDLLAEYDRTVKEVIATGREQVVLDRAILADGKTHILKTLRKPLQQEDGKVSTLTIAMDITELKRAEESLRRLNRSLKLLGECNAATIHIGDERQLLGAICKLAVKTGGYRMAWVACADACRDGIVRPVAQYGHDDGYLEQVVVDLSGNTGKGPTGMALKTGTTQVNPSFADNPQMAPWREQALARGFLSSIAVPFKHNGEVLGVLTIYAEEADAFNLAEIKLLEELAENLAFGIQAIRTVALREAAEAELNSERTRLRTLIRTIPDLIWLKDPDGVYLSCNPQFERFFGAKEADIIGKTDYDFVDKELADFFRQKDREAIFAGHPKANEEWITYPANGQRALLETIKMPMYEEGGKLIGVMGIARDITERERAEERESRLLRTLDHTRDMIFMFHPDTLRFVYMNKGALDNSGYAEAELRQLTPSDLSPQIPEPQFREFIAPLIAGERGVRRFETRFRGKNGRDLPVEVLLQLVHETGGEQLFVAVVRDITERKRAEQELQRQKAFMSQVIDTDPNRILVKDGQGNILLANRSMAAAHGLQPEDVIGRNIARIGLCLDAVATYMEEDSRVIAQGDEISRVDTFTHPDGNPGWLLTVKKRLTMPDGKPSVLSITTDITQQKLSEVQLAESYKELQQLSLHLENIRAEERASIALNLHDEMGATLAAVKMGIAWLTSKLPADKPDLKTEAAHIAELVSDGIHTMHRIVTQLRPNLLGDFGLAAAITDYARKFRQHTGIECVLDLPDGQMSLNADQTLTLFRITQESLNNVFKHAQAKRVDIVLTERADMLTLTIRDDGIGFEPFAHKARSFGLLGIKERALMIGGKARISSSIGKGTRVSVTLPTLGIEAHKRKTKTATTTIPHQGVES